MSFLWISTFNIIKWPSLLLLIFFFKHGISFPILFYFNLVLSLDLKYVSYEKHMTGFCSCIHSGNLYLLIEVFRTFTFNVIIDRIRFMSNYFGTGFLFSFSIYLRVHWIIITILFYLLLAKNSWLLLFQYLLWVNSIHF